MGIEFLNKKYSLQVIVNILMKNNQLISRLNVAASSYFFRECHVEEHSWVIQTQK